MGGVIPYARMRPNVTNYVVGGTSVDNTGGVIGGSSPTGPSTWGTGTPSAAASFVLSSGANFAYQAYVIQPAVLRRPRRLAGQRLMRFTATFVLQVSSILAVFPSRCAFMSPN